MNILVTAIKKQVEKENSIDIWKNSVYADIIKLKSNNIGIIGEEFISKLCKLCDIKCNINGRETKVIGGGFGDGTILDKTVEIKTAHRGSVYPTFQHELGEVPWKADIMIFVDIDPNLVYLTIFTNFSEHVYKTGEKCSPYFPTKKITWRKKRGCFKLDTTVKINEDNSKTAVSFKITNDIDVKALKQFILSKIETDNVVYTLSKELSNLSI